MINLIKFFKDKLKLNKMENQEEVQTSTGSTTPDNNVVELKPKVENSSSLENIINEIKVENTTGKLDTVVKHLDIALQSYKQVMGIK